MKLKKLIRSFHFASEGIVYAINTQRNMKIHISIALFILLLGMYLHFNQLEVLITFFCIALVISAEIFNTAIEKTVDMLTKEYNHSAKIAKDSAAGAVLFTVLIVILIGVVLILPYLQVLFSGDWIKPPAQPLAFYSLQALFLLLTTYILKAYWYRKNIDRQPDIIIGIFFYLISLLSLYNSEIRFILVSILLLFLIVLFYKRYSWLVIIQNGIISIGGVYLLHLAFY
ncbi:MAG: diacylglycerol kinase family protein [Vulcanibacillus sp.]